MENETYERLVRQSMNGLTAYSRAMLRDSAAAEDATQEALVRLWRHRDGVREETALVWLRRTLHNLCVDRLRRRRFRTEVDDGWFDRVPPHPGHEPDRLASSGELGGMIRRALGRLDPHDRAVLVLREIQGLPYAEIAEILEVPLGTLKARLHRARERLRERLVREGVTP